MQRATEDSRITFIILSNRNKRKVLKVGSTSRLGVGGTLLLLLFLCRQEAAVACPPTDADMSAGVWTPQVRSAGSSNRFTEP